MKEAFDRYAMHYRRVGNVPPDYAAAQRDPEQFRIVAPWLPNDRNNPILDVGCGWGNFLLGLWVSGYRNLTGIELSREQYEIARASLPPEIRLFHADARDFLKTIQEQFGFVTVLDLIEHLTRDEGLALLRLIHGVLEARGSIVIRTTNMANLIASYTRHIDLTHVVGYTEVSLFQLLDLAGFIDHKIIGPIMDMRFWRWYAPWRGFMLRERLSAFVHRLVYRLVALRPMPRALGFNLTVQTFKK